MSKASRASLLQWADQILQVGFLVGLARTCDLRLLGTYITLTAFWNLGVQLIDFGLNHSLVKEAAAHENPDTSLAAVGVAKTAGFAILFTGLLGWFAVSGAPLVYLLLTGMPVIALRCLCTTLSALLIGRQQLQAVVFSQFCLRLLLIGLVWTVLLRTEHMSQVILCHLFLESGLALYFWLRSGRPGRRVFRSWRFEKFTYLIKAGAVTGLTTGGILMISRQPQFWMEYALSGHTALYGIALRGIDLVLIPVNAVFWVQLPRVMESRATQTAWGTPFLRYLGPVSLLFFCLAALSYVIPPNICAMIAPGLSPLDRSLWAVCVAAGLTILVFSSCFNLFVADRLHIALPVMGSVNIVMALGFTAIRAAGRGIVLWEGLAALNLCLAAALLALFTLEWVSGLRKQGEES